MRLSKVLAVGAATSIATGLNLDATAQATQQVIVTGTSTPPTGHPFSNSSLWNPYSASAYNSGSSYGSGSYPEGESWTVTQKSTTDAAKSTTEAAAENAAGQWQPPCIQANETASAYQARATTQCGNDIYSRLPSHSVPLIGLWARYSAARYVCQTALQPKIQEIAILRPAANVCSG